METQFTKKEFTRSQVSLLSKSMLIAGLFFLIIGLGGWGFSYVFTDPYGRMRTLLPLFLVIMFTGMFISIMWTKVLFSGRGKGAIAAIFAVYTITEALSFGYIFSLLRDVNGGNMNLVPVAFAITGGIFLLTVAISKLMTLRSVFTMGKMIGAAAIAMAVLMFISLILAIVAMASGSIGVMKANDTFFMFGMAGLSLITFLYICIDVWTISKMSDFMQYNPEMEGSSIIVWYAGFRLLTDLLNILLIVCWYLLRFAGRRR